MEKIHENASKNWAELTGSLHAGLNVWNSQAEPHERPVVRRAMDDAQDALADMDAYVTLMEHSEALVGSERAGGLQAHLAHEYSELSLKAHSAVEDRMWEAGLTMPAWNGVLQAEKVGLPLMSSEEVEFVGQVKELAYISAAQGQEILEEVEAARQHAGSIPDQPTQEMLASLGAAREKFKGQLAQLVAAPEDDREKIAAKIRTDLNAFADQHKLFSRAYDRDVEERLDTAPVVRLEGTAVLDFDGVVRDAMSNLKELRAVTQALPDGTRKAALKAIHDVKDHAIELHKLAATHERDPEALSREERAMVKEASTVVTRAIKIAKALGVPAAFDKEDYVLAHNNRRDQLAAADFWRDQEATIGSAEFNRPAPETVKEKARGPVRAVGF